LRFDDRLETSLRFAGDSNENPLARWKQIVDIISQNSKQFPKEQIAKALFEARRLMIDVPAQARLLTVKSLSGRIYSAPMIQLLAGDLPDIASAAISGANLTDEDWSGIVPTLPVRARGFLRNRKDLGVLTRRSLQAWASADFVLTDGLAENENAPSLKIDPNETNTVRNASRVQISDIVERIERLRKNRENNGYLQLTLKDVETKQPIITPNEIRFETDDWGTIIWVEGAPRGAIVGVSVSEPAFNDAPGPDANGASAFRQRMPIENARMRLCGAPTVEGDWRINASPFFDSISGRFRGYRGILRQPNASESAEISTKLADSGDQIQQLVHELRTPLGAIIGFSEIIEQQLFGPAATEYRTLARNILDDARQLLAGFDDISMAAKLESGRFLADLGVTECGWLAKRLAKRLQGLSDSLSVVLNLSIADPVRPFATEIELTERIFSRLLSAIIIGCEAGEELNGRFRTELGQPACNQFILSLPKKLQGLSESELLGSFPIEKEPNIEAPLLGLGFSLRLVRNLARNVRGDLRFQKESLLMILPASDDYGLNILEEEKD
jgi:His Kinase A (phospho-acceptor) domain